jgi:hypothetical protein
MQQPDRANSFHKRIGLALSIDRPKAPHLNRAALCKVAKVPKIRPTPEDIYEAISMAFSITFSDDTIECSDSAIVQGW